MKFLFKIALNTVLLHVLCCKDEIKTCCMRNYSPFKSCLLPCTQWGIHISLCIGLLLLSGCGDNNSKTKRKGDAIQVETTLVKREQLERKQLVSGVLEPIKTVRIYTEEEGRLLTLPFYEGQQVKQNQLIATLDDAIVQRELDKARALARQAQLDLKRLKRLMPRKLTSEDELARAETQLQQAEAEEKLLETRLSHTRLTSPIDGVITERLREAGDVVSVHTQILTIADISQLKIKINLSELFLTQLNPDAPVSIRIDALGDQYFQGKILRIHPTIDAPSRQGIIEILMDSIPPGARPGQLCRVEIKSRTAPRLIVPFVAIQHDTLGEFVYLVSDQETVKKQRIQTGIQIGQYVEILDGLDIDDEIVSKGFLRLDDGKKITVITPKPPEAQPVTPATKS